MRISITDESLRQQIIEISEEDLVYSPWATEKQYKRGTWGEEKLQCWLDGQNISYRTEKDLRGEFPKTPDCLLDKPIKVNGWNINWIESKATFGDRVEVNKNMKKQLEPYLELFGQGVVIYWFGFVDADHNTRGHLHIGFFDHQPNLQDALTRRQSTNIHNASFVRGPRVHFS